MQDNWSLNVKLVPRPNRVPTSDQKKGPRARIVGPMTGHHRSTFDFYAFDPRGQAFRLLFSLCLLCFYLLAAGFSFSLSFLPHLLLLSFVVGFCPVNAMQANTSVKNLQVFFFSPQLNGTIMSSHLPVFR